jgi:3',5'-cyclic AMP phosphodiesterase CpdA
MNTNITLTRRQMLRLSAGSLLAAGLWPGALEAEGVRAAEEFYFLVVNDTHFVDQRCGHWLERVIGQIKRHAEKIDFCILGGDLSDHGKPEELAAVQDLFRGLGLPIHVVIGNHDYLADDDRKAFEELFPRSFNYTFEHRGWQFVGLDTSDGRRARVSAQPPTLRWLDDNLPRLDARRPTVVFTHFPLGPRVIYRLDNADEVLARFQKHNLRAILSGHFHAHTERQVGEVVLTTKRCCAISRGNHDGSKEKGYSLCHAKEGKVQRTFVEVKPA